MLLKAFYPFQYLPSSLIMKTTMGCYALLDSLSSKKIKFQILPKCNQKRPTIFQEISSHGKGYISISEGTNKIYAHIYELTS